MSMMMVILMTVCVDGGMMTARSPVKEKCEQEKEGKGPYSFVACVSHLTIDHASISRRSTVPTSNRDTGWGGA